MYNSWSAICRGAVHRAKIVNTPPPAIDGSNHNMEVEVVNVVSRVSRLNYGITKFVPFIDNIHDAADKFFMPSLGKYVAVDQMHWYLKQVSLSVLSNHL
jgi:hypothetical protein